MRRFVTLAALAALALGSTACKTPHDNGTKDGAWRFICTHPSHESLPGGTFYGPHIKSRWACDDAEKAHAREFGHLSTGGCGRLQF